MKKDNQQKDNDQKKNRQPEVDTPRPPQVMDPSRPLENENRGSEKDPAKHGRKEGKKSEKKDKKKKLLGESPLEIDDETTI
jgi:hypothetical protein